MFSFFPDAPPAPPCLLSFLSVCHLEAANAAAPLALLHTRSNHNIYCGSERPSCCPHSSDGGERQGEPNAEPGLFPREAFCSDPNSWCDPVQKPPSLATWDTVTRELREVSQKWNSVPLGVQKKDCFFGRELQKR